MSLICPYCSTAIGSEPSDFVECPSCATAHHQDCWNENGGCTVFGCAAAPPDEPKILVAADWSSPETGVSPERRITPPPPRPTPPPPAASAEQSTTPDSLLTAAAEPLLLALPPAHSGFPASVPGNGRALRIPPPPPPRPGVSAPMNVPTFGYPRATSYASNNPPLPYQPKNRVTFILLGIFLGFLGTHNFYAGYTKRGLVQLCISVCTLFLGAIISWIWAVVEVCIVDRDRWNHYMV